MNVIKQNDYIFIPKYYNEICDIIKIMSKIKKVTQKSGKNDTWCILYETGEYTILEIDR